MPSPRHRGAAPFHRASRALGVAAALRAALDGGILEVIADSARAVDAAEVAAASGLQPGPTALLLDALVDAEVLRRPSLPAGGTYELAIPVEAVRSVLAMWSALPELLRTGRPHRTVDLGGAGTSYAPVATALGDLDPTVGARFADAVGAPGRRVLDLGAGSATWGRALAERHPGVELTVLDLPEVAAVAEVILASAGLADRTIVVGGDLFTAELDGPFDTVVVANVCRLFGETEVRRLLGRVAAVTAPGGRVVIVDALPDADRPGEASIGVYALGLALRTCYGGVHPLAAYRTWLHDAGFIGVDTVPLGEPELTLIRADRPG